MKKQLKADVHNKTTNTKEMGSVIGKTKRDVVSQANSMQSEKSQSLERSRQDVEHVMRTPLQNSIAPHVIPDRVKTLSDGYCLYSHEKMR